MDRSLFPVPPRAVDFRLIGWGAGWDFTTHYPGHGIEVAYTIDIRPHNVGNRIHGIEVRAPEALKHENPDECLVLVYSSACFEAFRQIRACGPFRAIRAHGDRRDAEAARRAVAHATSAEFPQRRRPARRAIVVQGPLHAGITSTILRFYASRHPDVAVVLSSWKGEDADELARLAPLCDSIVLNDPPAVAGDHNRNYQIRSTLAGLEEAKRLGAARVAKTRTDAVVDAPNLLDILDDAVGAWPVTGALRGHVRERIVVLSSASWRYVPYHYSDQVMYGDVDDLRRYWSVPLQASPFAPLPLNGSYVELSRSGFAPECYFAAEFLKRCGRPTPATVEHSWEVLRDGFVMVDGTTLGWLWWKMLAFLEDPPSDAMPDPHLLQSAHSHALWRSLVEGESWRHVAKAIDGAPPRLSDFWSGARVATA